MALVKHPKGRQGGHPTATPRVTLSKSGQGTVNRAARDRFGLRNGKSYEILVDVEAGVVAFDFEGTDYAFYRNMVSLSSVLSTHFPWAKKPECYPIHLDIFEHEGLPAVLIPDEDFFEGQSNG